MGDERFKIVSVNEPSFGASTQKSLRRQRLQNLREKKERMWESSKEEFDPTRNALERERVERELSLISNAINLKNANILDIGCGVGSVAERLDKMGAQVVAIDIASQAVRFVNSKSLHAKHEALPIVDLPDDSFDGVLCLNVIAELESQDHRLSMAEMCRMMKREGYVVVSSDLDMDTMGAKDLLEELFCTEFKVIASRMSYHGFYLKFFRLLDAPEKYYRGYRSREFREIELAKREGFSKVFYRMFSSFPLSVIFGAISLVTKPFAGVLRQNRQFLLVMEKMCKMLNERRGVSHATFVGIKKPLLGIK